VEFLKTMNATRSLTLAMTMSMGMIAGLQASVTEHQPPAPLPEFKTPEQLAKWRSDIATHTANQELTSSRPSTLDSSTPFYTGKPYLAESSSYSFKYREYNPEMGRWITVDSSGFPDGLNNKIYVNNAPNHKVDNNGLSIVTIDELFWNSISYLYLIPSGVPDDNELPSYTVDKLNTVLEESPGSSVVTSVIQDVTKNLLFDNVQVIKHNGSEPITRADINKPILIGATPNINPSSRTSFYNINQGSENYFTIYHYSSSTTHYSYE